MNKVVTINLGGRAYQFEESAYTALSAYLSNAESTLAENPDKGEIIRDLEIAIAEKSERFLNPAKNVVTEEETKKIIDEMGPVGTSQKSEGSTKSEPNAPKKLYLIREGALVAGVTTGLAAYLGLDVTLIRIIFAALTVLTGGGFILAYIAMAILIPYADTAQEKAEARGLPFNAQELIDRAKKSYAEFADKGGWEHWGHHGAIHDHKRKAREQRRYWEARANAWRRDYAYKYEYRPGGSHFLGFVSAVLGMLWVVALLSLISSGTVFGWTIPATIPLWVAIIVLFLIYHAVTGPIKAARYGANGRGYDSWAGFEDSLGILFLVIAFIFAYTHYPQVHDTVNMIPERIREWWQARGN